jgi:hypothetical protein
VSVLLFTLARTADLVVLVDVPAIWEGIYAAIMGGDMAVMLQVRGFVTDLLSNSVTRRAARIGVLSVISRAIAVVKDKVPSLVLALQAVLLEDVADAEERSVDLDWQAADIFFLVRTISLMSNKLISHGDRLALGASSVIVTCARLAGACLNSPNAPSWRSQLWGSAEFPSDVSVDVHVLLSFLLQPLASMPAARAANAPNSYVPGSVSLADSSYVPLANPGPLGSYSTAFGTVSTGSSGGWGYEPDEFGSGPSMASKKLAAKYLHQKQAKAKYIVEKGRLRSRNSNANLGDVSPHSYILALLINIAEKIGLSLECLRVAMSVLAGSRSEQLDSGTLAFILALCENDTLAGLLAFDLGGFDFACDRLRVAADSVIAGENMGARAVPSTSRLLFARGPLKLLSAMCSEQCQGTMMRIADHANAKGLCLSLAVFLSLYPGIAGRTLMRLAAANSSLVGDILTVLFDDSMNMRKARLVFNLLALDTTMSWLSCALGSVEYLSANPVKARPSIWLLINLIEIPEARSQLHVYLTDDHFLNLASWMSECNAFRQPASIVAKWAHTDDTEAELASSHASQLQVRVDGESLVSRSLKSLAGKVSFKFDYNL